MRVRRLDHFGVDGNCALFLQPNRQPGGLDQIRNPLGKPHHAFEVAYADLVAAQALFAADPDGNLLEIVGYRERQS